MEACNSIIAGDIESVKKHLDEHPNIISCLLRIAINFEKLDIVQVLLEHKADVNYCTELKHNAQLTPAYILDNAAPLVIAAKNGNINLIDLLLKNKADIHIQSNMPLKFACTMNKLDAVKFLLESKADPNYYDKKLNIIRVRRSPLENAVQEDIGIRLLLEYGAKVHDKDYRILNQAISRNPKALETLLEYTTIDPDYKWKSLRIADDINQTNRKDWHPLAYAVHVNKSLIDLLLTKFTDAYPILLAACAINDRALVERFVHAPRTQILDPVSIVIDRHNYPLLEYLLKNKIDFNAGNAIAKATENLDDIALQMILQYVNSNNIRIFFIHWPPLNMLNLRTVVRLLICQRQSLEHGLIYYCNSGAPFEIIDEFVKVGVSERNINEDCKKKYRQRKEATLLLGLTKRNSDTPIHRAFIQNSMSELFIFTSIFDFLE